jgi:hypothetical protein
MTSPAGSAKRHYCTAGDRYPHTSGDGAPKRKKCGYCGGTLATMAGTWGAFEWHSGGRYHLDGAIRAFVRESAAERFASAGNLVVRWIPA